MITDHAPRTLVRGERFGTTEDFRQKGVLKGVQRRKYPLNPGTVIEGSRLLLWKPYDDV